MEVGRQSIEALLNRPGAAALPLLQEWMQSDPLDCSRTSLTFLQAAASAQHETLLRLLGSSDSLAFMLANAAVPLVLAEDLFKRIIAAYPESAYRLLAAVGPGAHAALLHRIVSLLGVIEDAAVATSLARKLLTHPDPHIQSKAKVLFGRANDNPEWLAHWVRDQLKNENGRVRANAVESLWKKPSTRARQVFRDCLADPHGRVQVNAMIGLHYLEEPGVMQLLLTLSEDADTNLRASAAFGMGQILAQECLPRLAELLQDPEALVRTAAFRAMLAIQKARRAKLALDTQAPRNSAMVAVEPPLVAP